MEKIFPTERAVAGHRLRIIPTILWPVTGLVTGTPVLVRKLTKPQRERRMEAAALQARQDKLAAQAAEADQVAFAKKLTGEHDPVKRAAMLQARETAEVVARQVAAEQAKAARKAARSRLGDAAGAAALLLVVTGPLIWSLVGTWIRPGIGLLAGAWWIAALIHAPAPGKGTEEGRAETDVEETAPAPPGLSAVTEPTPADARRAVAALGAHGGHVALADVTARLAAEHPLWARSGKATKGLLSEAGIRYRSGVKIDGNSVPGIHHDDIPPLPSPVGATPRGVVVAGQSNNNNHNNPEPAPPREGFVTRPDPDNPAHTIVVHAA